ncbi:MAG: hypothetical protein KDB80_00335 [Planctomycetes bacterium]|nr:hypothetical protein [Planctomycetota bacterium]
MVLDWLASLDGGWLAGLAVALFALACIGIGSLGVGRCIGRGEDRPGLRLVALAAVGVNGFGLAGLGAGFLGLVDTSMVWIGLVGLAAVGAYRERSTLRRSLRAAWPNEAAFVVVLLVLGAFFYGSTGIFPGGWDSLTYQVAIPYRWIELGRPDVLLDLPYSGFPSLLQLILWPLVTVGGVTVPRTLQWAFYVFVFAALYALLRARTSRFPSVAMVLAFALSPVCLVMVKDVYAEPLILVDIVGALAVLVSRRDGSKPSLGPFVVVGALAGAACAVKLAGVGTAAVVFGLALGSLPRRSLVGAASALVVAATAAALPFYLRPWLQTGNPLYPFFARWFTSEPATLAMSQMHHDMGGHYGLPGVSGFFGAPFVAAFDGSRFDGIFVGWQVALLLLACSVTIVVQIRARALTLAGRCAIGALFLYVFWFATAQQTRFMLPMFVVASIGASGLVAAAARWRPRLGAVSAVLFLLVTAEGVSREDSALHYVAAWQGGWRRDPVGALTAVAGNGYVKAIRAVLHETPEDANLLLLFERRGLYVPRHHEIGTPYFQARRFTPPTDSAEDVHRALLEGGFDHVLFSPSTRNPDVRPKWLERQQPILRALEAMLENGQIELLWKGHGYRLVRVVPG